MRIFKFPLALLALAAMTHVSIAATSITQLVIKDGNGTTRNIDVLDLSGAGTGPFIPMNSLTDATGAQITSGNPLSVALTAAIPIGSNVIGGVTQSGTWNITNISGTISLPTGAATSANQSTMISSLATIATNTGAAIPAGSSIIGKVGIDQTTPGTTNGVQVNAALPAGTNLIGKFGIDQTTPGTTNGVVCNSGCGGSYDSGPITVNATPANSSHAAGSSVGGLFTIGLARTSGGTGQLNSLLFKDTNNTAESYVVRVWSRNPSSTTCTDGTAFASNATDDGYLMGTGPTPITTAAPNVATGDSNVYASLPGLGWSYATNGNANIYVCVITVNTYTPGATKPFYVTASGPQN